MAQKEGQMPHISNVELVNLRRAAARGDAVAAKATAPKPKAKPVAPKPDPHRAEKVKLLANAPAALKAELLKPGVSLGTVRAAVKAISAAPVAKPPKPHLQLAPDGTWVLTPQAKEKMRLDKMMGVNRASGQVFDAHTWRAHTSVHQYELDLAEANGATIRNRKAIGVQH